MFQLVPFELKFHILILWYDDIITCDEKIYTSCGHFCVMYLQMCTLWACDVHVCLERLEFSQYFTHRLCQESEPGPQC